MILSKFAIVLTYYYWIAFDHSFVSEMKSIYLMHDGVFPFFLNIPNIQFIWTITNHKSQHVSTTQNVIYTSSMPTILLSVWYRRCTTIVLKQSYHVLYELI